MSSNNQLVGTWKLLSAEYRGKDGKALDYWGDNPVGVLMYDASGRMAVQLMRRDRPTLVSGDRLSGTPAEIKSAFEGYLAYFGTFTVNEKEGSVVHRLEGCSFPNWIGVDQKRFYQLTGNQLTLRTPPLLIRGEQVVGYLVWERAGDASV